MAVPEEAEIHEVFKLFDQEGSGIKIKEIGTVMRSLGLAAPEAQLREFVAEAAKKDSNHVQFSDFMGYVRRAQTMEADKSVDVAKEMQGMKNGIGHFFDKLSHKQIRENPPDMVKIADIKHLLSSVGEKMAEEEIEEMAREIRNSCRIQDGRVSFDDFVKMLQA
uniref:Calmodulin n=1 Tax=Pyrodinium bahamense TaxID=73915 RepID=A0A7S0AIB1_9DINO